jgi:hypothetical protein
MDDEFDSSIEHMDDESLFNELDEVGEVDVL